MAFKPYCSKCQTWHYHCPRCSSTDTVPDKPMLTCMTCNYVGPIDNPNQNGRYLVSRHDQSKLVTSQDTKPVKGAT